MIWVIRPASCCRPCSKVVYPRLKLILTPCLVASHHWIPRFLDAWLIPNHRQDYNKEDPHAPRRPSDSMNGGRIGSGRGQDPRARTDGGRQESEGQEQDQRKQHDHQMELFCEVLESRLEGEVPRQAQAQGNNTEEEERSVRGRPIGHYRTEQSNSKESAMAMWWKAVEKQLLWRFADE